MGRVPGGLLPFRSGPGRFGVGRVPGGLLPFRSRRGRFGVGRVPGGLLPFRSRLGQFGVVQPGPLRLHLGAGPVLGTNPAGDDSGPGATDHGDPDHGDLDHGEYDDPDPGSYSGTEFPGPDYPALGNHSSSRAHVAWGREQADEPGEGDW